MSGFPLILAFVAAIVLMILAISKWKIHPFLSIMGISLVLGLVAGVPLVVTDRDHTVAAAGAGREALEKPLHTNYTHLMEQRRAWQAAQGLRSCATARGCRPRPWRPFWQMETLWALWRWYAAGRRPAKKKSCWQNWRQHYWAASWRAERALPAPQ